MYVNDFRRIALSLEGAVEGSHMGQPDFRVGGRIFATLASADQGYGNLMLTPEQQATFGWLRPTRICWLVPYRRHGSYGERRTRNRARGRAPRPQRCG